MTPIEAAESNDSRIAGKQEALPVRSFGRPGIPMPILGLGGQSLIQHSPDDEPVIRMINRAIDLGIRYIDTAPIYGPSEDRIGKAIEHRRQDVFLATKTLYRRGSSALRSFERSLKRLRTDHVDVLQFHCFMDRSEIGAVFGRGGVVKMAERLKEQGMVRHIGITGHYHPAILSELLRRYPFDSVLLPVNPADPLHLSFIHDTIGVAREMGASVAAMKVMGAGYLTGQGFNAADLLRYALSWPVSVAIVSCQSVQQLESNVHAACEFVPMPDEELRALEARSPGIMETCNNIYKLHGGKHGRKAALRNWLAAELLKWIPGWWKL